MLLQKTRNEKETRDLYLGHVLQTQPMAEKETRQSGSTTNGTDSQTFINLSILKDYTLNPKVVVIGSVVILSIIMLMCDD